MVFDKHNMYFRAYWAALQHIKNLILVTHAQETCNSRLAQETCTSDMLSWTGYKLSRYVINNPGQLSLAIHPWLWLGTLIAGESRVINQYDHH